jgi:acyl carrier protein
LNLIMEIQKEYGIKIEIEEMFEIEKLGDIHRLLQKKNAAYYGPSGHPAAH